MPQSAAPERAQSTLRSLALVAAGAALTLVLGGVLLLADLRFDGGRLLHAAMGTEALTEACRAPLVRQLAEKGFEPDEFEFGPAPTLGSPFARERSFGDSFTFRDGAGQLRVDGVVACVVSGTSVRVEFRVGSAPHRDAWRTDPTTRDVRLEPLSSLPSSALISNRSNRLEAVLTLPRDRPKRDASAAP